MLYLCSEASRKTIGEIMPSCEGLTSRTSKPQNSSDVMSKTEALCAALDR